MHLALAQTQNNVSKAARMLGVSRDYLRYRLAQPKPDPKADASQDSTDAIQP